MLANKCGQIDAGKRAPVIIKRAIGIFCQAFRESLSWGRVQLEARSDEGIAKGGSRLKMLAIRTAMAVFSCQHLIAI